MVIKSKRYPRTKTLYGCIIMLLIMVSEIAYSQNKEWKTGKSDDGKISVSYNISTRADEKGNAVNLVEYTAVTIDNLEMQNCISVLKDPTKHKIFQDAEISNIIKTVSENEWIFYYYFKAPWPLSDSDGVTRMTLSKTEDGRTVIFSQTAAPLMYEGRDVSRFDYYNLTYRFDDIGEGQIKTTLTAQMTPAVSVPRWMIKAAFPASVISMVEKLMKLIKE